MFGFNKATVIAALSISLSVAIFHHGVEEEDTRELQSSSPNARNEAFEGLRNLQSVADTVRVTVKSIAASVLHSVFHLSIPGLRIHKQAACLLAFQLSNFDLLKTKKYKKWFTEDSVMQLHVTGSYYGLDGIQEYVDFFYSRDFLNYDGLTDPALFFDLITSDSDTCQVTYAIKRQIKLADYLFEPDTCLEFTGASTLYYDLDSDDTFITVNRMNIYAPETFFTASGFFATAKLDAFRSKVCELTESKCESVWEENSYETQTDCEQDLEGLDLVQNEVYFDGNALACKWLHSSFIAERDNLAHCPHLSKTPMIDEDGKFKCQNSTYAALEDLFSPEELAFIEDKALNEYGFDESQFATC